MRLGITLPGERPEAGRIDAIERRDLRQDVPPRIVGGAARRPRARDRVDLELREGRRRHQPLVRIDLGPGRVIDGQELRLVEQDHLFELVVEVDQELPVARHETASLDAHVLVGVGNAVAPGRLEIADRAAAQEVGHELELLPVPAGGPLAVQLLDREDAIGLDPDLGLQDTARPADRDRVGLLHRAEAHPDDRRILRQVAVVARDLDLLVERTGANLDLGAKPHPVAAQPFEPHPEPVIGRFVLVAQEARAAASVQIQDIDPAVAVEVGRGGRARPLLARKAPGEDQPAVAEVFPELSSLGPQHVQIEVAVVVVVQDAGAEARSGRQRAEQLR